MKGEWRTRTFCSAEKRDRAIAEVAFLVLALAAIGAVLAGGIEIAVAQKTPGMSKGITTSRADGGHLYMQTNEIQNAIIHYRRDAKGALTEVKRVPTGGAGSGVVSPIYHISRMWSGPNECST